MKKIIFIIAGICISYLVVSQDLVITNDDDSINCKIEKIEGYNISYSFVRKNRIQNEYTLMKNIKDYEVNYFDYSKIDEFKRNIFHKIPHFSLGINFGYSYQIETIEPFMQHDTLLNSYKGSQDQLRSGLNLGANLTYFFPRIFGLGIKSSFFLSSSDYLNSENYSNYKLKQSSIYVGPAMYFRILTPDKNNAFIMSASVGYMHFSINEKPKDKSIVSKNKITGNSLGYSFGIEYNRKLTNYISAGLNSSFIMGHLSSYKISTSTSYTETYNLNKEPYGNLNRFDFSLVLRFIII